MNKYVESYQLPNLTQEDIDNLNSPIAILKNNFVFTDLPIKKTQGSDGFNGEYYQHIKKKMVSIVHKFPQRIEKKTF